MRVDRQGVHLHDGRIVPAAYTLVMPPLRGVTGIATSPDLTAADGFVPVDARYRHLRHAGIYAAGVAAHLGTTSSLADRLPKTSHLALATAKAAARNLAAAITGGGPVAQVLPRLLDLRLLDGGDTGVLLVSADLIRPLRRAVPLPGHLAHGTKVLLAHYLLWKLRTGRVALP